MDITTALAISAHGMDAQSTRLRTVAENLANQDTTGSSPGADPYRRKVVEFEGRVDRSLGAETVHVRRIEPVRFDGGVLRLATHPAADAKGYVKVPNVNSFVEVMDMREAQRSYSANLNVMEASRSMLTRTIEMLR